MTHAGIEQQSLCVERVFLKLQLHWLLQPAMFENNFGRRDAVGLTLCSSLDSSKEHDHGFDFLLTATVKFLDASAGLPL